jgi:TonB family protein
MVIVYCLMVSSSEQSHTMTVRAGALTEAPIVFMPMQRVVQAQAPVAQTQQPQKNNTQVTSRPPEKKIVKAPEKVIAPQKVTPQPEPKKVEQKVVKKTASVAQKTVTQQNVVKVGRDELAEVTLQRHVMEQLKKSWHPPAGVEPDAHCTICFKVNAQGKVDDVVVKESSKSTLYDIAVRTAVLRAEFPASARTKEFTVAFKP